MFKKIAITAILLGLFLAGSLIADDPPIEPNPLIVHIQTDELLQWRLDVYSYGHWPDPIEYPGQGTGNINTGYSQGKPYEFYIFLNGEYSLFQSGDLPMGTDWFEIVVPISLPGHDEDPQE
ncbi:MAG: hypothetical protein J7M10_06590 [Candidatus Cloacimonetes bacterium]|nr:hypothetical protein [Candidatus Cloacimonadota bacterium]